MRATLKFYCITKNRTVLSPVNDGARQPLSRALLRPDLWFFDTEAEAEQAARTHYGHLNWTVRKVQLCASAPLIVNWRGDRHGFPAKASTVKPARKGPT